MNLSQLFFEPRMDLFEAIVTNGHHAASAARKANLSYAYATKIVKMLESNELIKRKKIWGKKKVRLEVTPYGIMVWRHLDAIKKIIRGDTNESV